MKKPVIFAKIFSAILIIAGGVGAQEIIIDQFGYREQAKKIAVIRGLSLQGGEFSVIDEATVDTVFSGSPVIFNDGIADVASGDILWHFDFSSVNAAGRYHIRGNGNIRSYSFRIGNDIYNDILRAAVRTFYYQRAGIAKTAQFAGAEWADGMAFEQDRRTRDFFAPNDASRERDLSGGWFDAGDYNKYTKWTADYIAEMFFAYEGNPCAFTDDFGIPESGNGIPDIIDEAKWGLDWLLRMQNDDGSMLSVQGLAHASPPSAATGTSFYGPPNATAAFGSVKAFAVAARVLQERGYANSEYINRLRTAAIKAWEWGFAHPDSMFANNVASNNSVGLAAGNQEIMDDGTGGRSENLAAAAFYLYELTGADSLLRIAETAMRRLPLFAWYSFMDHYRHSQHILFMDYLKNPSGDPQFKNDIRNAMRTAFVRPDDFYGAHRTDGYRAFIADYNWGSNKAKADYGLTFYRWHEIDPSIDRQKFREIAEGYLHYLHGVNPFNWVYLTNMERYGATRSQRTFYHAWFSENSPRWSITTATTPGPAPGFLVGGPNSRYKWDGCCPSACGSTQNNARCFLVEIPDSNITPPARMFVETNVCWPINSWEITENSNGYQMSYIRLLSKFVNRADSPISITPNRPQNSQPTAGGIRYQITRRGVELQVNQKAEVSIFSINGRMLSKRNFSAGAHTVSLARLPKGVYIVRINADGHKKDLRISWAQ